MRVLVFGDSITQGFWDSSGGWVARLRKHYDKLQLEDLQNRDEPTIFNQGVSADTTQEIIKRFEPETRARTRHGVSPIVIVQIGTNDSCIDHGKIRVSPEEYQENLLKLINISKQVASKLIFVGSSSCDEHKTTPAAWGDYHYTNERIKKYEDIMRRVAADNGITFIPIFEKFAQTVKSGEDLLADGLHPNDAGHQLMHEIIGTELKRLVP